MMLSRWLVSGILAVMVSVASAEALWDFDIRCCLDEPALEKVFYIKLSSPEHDAVAELQIINPGGEKIGVNDELLTYYPPSKQGLYALGDRPDKPIDSPIWDFTRLAILFRQFSGPSLAYQTLDDKLIQSGDYRLPKGNYTIRVLGKTEGSYILKVCPYGNSGECVSKGEKISRNAVHMYSFSTGKLSHVQSNKTRYQIDTFSIKSK